MYRLAALLFAVALAILVPSPANATSDFYIPPANVAGTPGSIIKAEPMRLALSLPTPDGTFPGTATRLMYRSTNTHDQPNAVTGTFIEPLAPWHGPGPRPLIAMAAGTQGQGDQCAPSKLLSQLIHYRFPLDLMSEYEVMAIDIFLLQGYAVALTDYEGLGTPAMHTYVNRLAQGHAVLDSARAALRLPGTDLTPKSPIFTWGYSQGGGASASAGELQPTYAPELNLRGIYAGGPTADLRAIMKNIDGTILAGAIGYGLNGLRTQYPVIQKLVDKEINKAGSHMLDATAHECVAETALRFGWARSSAFTKTGETVSQILDRTPEAGKIVDSQRIGLLKPTAPVLIHHNVNDDMLPYGQARQLAADWCKLGATVWMTTVNLPAIIPTTAVGHALPDLTFIYESNQFIRAALAGAPARSNC